MNEQNGNEKDNEKQIERKKKKNRMSKEKRLYLVTAAACAAVLVSIVIGAIIITGSNQVDDPEALRGSSVSSSITENSSNTPDSGNSKPNDSSSTDEPVINTPETMISPLATVTVSNDYGFYYNQTLNKYYEHQGVDFVAAAGTEVLAVASGTIESIYKDDILSGTEITLDHGDGRKSVYRFVEEAEGLKVGDTVARGDVIATVAEANGDEYKDGAHLHFEILEDGKTVDPTLHLTLEEK